MLGIPGSWDITLRPGDDCRRFERTCGLHLEGLKVHSSWTHRYIPQFPALLLRCYENFKTRFITVIGEGRR